SIGAELTELVGVAETVIGSDLDDVRLAMAAHNVPGAYLLRADALRPVTRDTTVVADPARRSGGRRTHAHAALPPPQPDLLAAYPAPGAYLLRADALRPVTRDPTVVADPARRSGGRRTHDPAALQPPLPDLLDAYAGRDLAVKCAPGLDFDSLDWSGEVEVVS